MKNKKSILRNKKKNTIVQKIKWTFNGFKIAIKNDWSFAMVSLMVAFGLIIVMAKNLGIIWFLIILIAGLRDLQAENNNSIIEDLCDMFGQDVIIELKGQADDIDPRIEVIKDRSSFSAFINHTILIVMIIIALLI